ncbi:MAG: APC family permease [Elusimicrobiota bacterium]|nr:MAG: APC family permease [Elusimicrobiota bacterium]
MKPEPRPGRRVTEVVVLTTAMLSFISFGRAAAIVLCDMASTAWYIGGIAETAIGPAAPWFILGVLLCAAPVLMLYVEGSAMFVRGGVYKVVREAMGGTLAKISVSALMFDYVLTGAISAVSGGQYLAGLLNSALPRLHIHWTVDPHHFAVVFALLVVAYFWRENIRGIEESSDKAIKIMTLVGVMAAVTFAWAGYTIWLRGFRWPTTQLTFTHESLGWFPEGLSLGKLGLLVALGHAFLGMSGLETLAQVYREMEAPKLKNLKRASAVIFFSALALTGTVSFLAVGLIPDDVRKTYADNLLSGLAMSMAGPHWAQLILQACVVLVGVVILSGAVNTSILGANGVLNRLAEDGIMPERLRHLHPKFGTTYRMINLVVLMQALTIVLCRGDVYLLGEAYAFGVIWSFVFNAGAVLVLRFQKIKRDWKVPFNVPLGGGRELPVGLALLFLLLLSVGIVNLLTKKVATISGAAFTGFFFALFMISERLNKRERAHGEHTEKFNLRSATDLAIVKDEIERPNRVLVAVRDPGNLYHLNKALESHDSETTDLVVFTSRIRKGLGLVEETVSMDAEEERLFTKVIEAAEKHGKTVTPMLVVSNEPFYAISQAAQAVGATEVVFGVSAKLSTDAQLERLAMTWGSMQTNKQSVRFRILGPGVEHAVDL